MTAAAPGKTSAAALLESMKAGQWKFKKRGLHVRCIKMNLPVHQTSPRSIGKLVFHGVCTAIFAASASWHPVRAVAAGGQAQVPQYHSQQAPFAHEHTSPEVQLLADWIVASGDSHDMPFVVIDKTDARVYVFYAEGQLHGAAPVLLGLALGDNAAPGIGQRKLSSIRPDERTTPAGRFVASLGRNLHGGEILWVDYQGAISMHPVVTSNAKERRAQRLATPTPLDNRISYGCINVSVDFFNTVVKPAFTGTNGIVYVLPETPAGRQVFALHEGFSPPRGLENNTPEK